MVKIEIMEGGTYLLRWNSMEETVPECRMYIITLEYKGQVLDTLGRVDAQGKKEYLLSPRKYNFFTYPFPEGAVVNVRPFVSKKHKIKEMDSAVYHSPPEGKPVNLQ